MDLSGKTKTQEIWAGRKFRCNITGIVFTIPDDVRECDFFSFGESFVDVGRAGFYCRFGGDVKEIKDE